MHIFFTFLLFTISSLYAMEKQNELVIACLAGDNKKIETLIQNGADPSGPNKFGVLPLVAAYDKDHVDAFKTLLELHADPNCSAQRTPLLIQSIVDDKWLFFKAILESHKCRSLDCIDPLGHTALIKACIYADRALYRKEIFACKAFIKDEDIKTAVKLCKGSAWTCQEEKVKISAELLQFQQFQQKKHYLSALNPLRISV